MKTLFQCSIFIVLLSLTAVAVKAQVPYFACTVGNGRVYGYTSVKVKYGMNQLESYHTVQFGLGHNFAVGADLYASGASTYYGLLARFGYAFNPYFKVGFQLTPSFDLSNKFTFRYLTSAFYLNGAITQNEKFLWVSNTWYGINNGANNTINQWYYLGYNFTLKNKQSITPMVGCLYSWMFDSDADMAVGVYYTYRKFNFYLWSDNLFNRHPRIVIGVDFAI